jgi:hypothetical protein
MYFRSPALHILVVEDDPVIADHILTGLHQHGYDESVLVGHEDNAASAILGSSAQRKIYYPQARRWGSFIIWNRARLQEMTDDEMIRLGLAAKTSAAMGHLPIGGPDGSLEPLRDLGAERRIYVHINNTNPVLLEDSPERRVVDERGWGVAADGLEVKVS